jgi:beta-lactam-binding protein with PASTA domain
VRTRRHTSQAFTFERLLPGRRSLRDLGLVVLTFVVGYVVSAVWLSPGPVLTTDHAVPRVLELSQAEAKKKLTELGFRVRVEGERPSDAVPRGAIVWQDPPPDLVLPPNSVVQVTLSGGPALVTVPDIIGLSTGSAEKILEAAGVRLGRVDTVRSGQEADVVLATRPAPGSGRPRGGVVDVVVSGGRGGTL